MSITTKEEAFQAIENSEFDIMPREAIRFLYNHEPDEEIRNKVNYFLRHAYTPYEEEYLNEYTEGHPVFIYYAIVAEVHHSEELISIVINELNRDVFKRGEFINDYVSKQANVLVCVLCKAYGERAIQAFLDAMLDAIIDVHDNRYTKTAWAVLELCDVVYYTSEKHFPVLKEMMGYKKCKELQFITRAISDMEYKAFIPVIEQFFAYWVLEEERQRDMFKVTSREIGLALHELKTGEYLYPDLKKPYLERVEAWEERYAWGIGPFQKPKKREQELLSELERLKKEADRNKKILDKMRSKVLNSPLDHRASKVVRNVPKVGRNAPCPCGSGKKYKRCCGKK